MRFYISCLHHFQCSPHLPNLYKNLDYGRELLQVLNFMFFFFNWNQRLVKMWGIIFLIWVFCFFFFWCYDVAISKSSETFAQLYQSCLIVGSINQWQRVRRYHSLDVLQWCVLGTIEEETGCFLQSKLVYQLQDYETLFDVMWRYSLYHRFQRCCFRSCASSHANSQLELVSAQSVWGTLVSGLTRRKWLRVRGRRTFGCDDGVDIGRELSIVSISII